MAQGYCRDASERHERPSAAIAQRPAHGCRMPRAPRGGTDDRVCAGSHALRALFGRPRWRPRGRRPPLRPRGALLTLAFGAQLGRGEHLTDPRHNSDAQDGVPRAGEIIASKYEVESVLGVGGMGVVVAARHLQLGQRVAVKFMRASSVGDPAAVARFLREARAVVALRSEHVARVLDVGTLDTGSPYIVMEFLDGLDLSQMIERGGQLSVAEAIGLLLQGCEAIAEAHSLGIVHRDLKPSNVFVARRADGTHLVKILDFGISKVSSLSARAEGNENLTGSGHVMGSPGYISPEQLRSTKAADARSDVWSLGVILYEMLTGRAPFIGETLGDILARIVSEAPTPVRRLRPDVPPALERVIEACLEKSVDRRVASVRDLAVRLLPFAPRGSEIAVERISRIAGAAGASAGSKTVALAEPAGASPGVAPSPGQEGPGASLAHQTRTSTAGASLAWKPDTRLRTITRLPRFAGAAAGLVLLASLVIGAIRMRGGRAAFGPAPVREDAGAVAAAEPALTANLPSTTGAAALPASEGASDAGPSIDASAPKVGGRDKSSGGAKRPARPTTPSPRPSSPQNDPEDLYGNRH